MSSTPTAVETTPTTVEINGYALRVIRVLSGVGARELAEKVGKDRSYITKIETGHARVSPATFNTLLAALAITDRRALLANPHGSPAA